MAERVGYLDDSVMRTPLIAGNWKMHMTLARARELVGGLRAGSSGFAGVEVLICPPFPLLYPVAEALAGTRIRLGAQNAHEAPEGAFTGEVSVPMLANAGCTYVIIGHSERRHVFGETGPQLARKVRAVAAGGLSTVYCVGETLEERESERTEAVVRQQMDDVVQADLNPEQLVIAYEPVWAIGTGRTATPGQAEEVHAQIRRIIAATFSPAVASTMRILYGGSVKPGNAADLLAQPDIDGALVGGACLVAADFLAIIAAATGVLASS